MNMESIYPGKRAGYAGLEILCDAKSINQS
jgi:hypothetical protein